MSFGPGIVAIYGDDVRRFWSKTKIDGACIIWTGSLDRDGYGKFMVGKAGKQRTFRPHRWIFQLSVGDPGPQLLHSCDRRACVKLQHLSPGSQSQNVQESFDRGRAKMKLTDDQIGEICALYDSGDRPIDIAARFGVSRGYVCNVALGRASRTRKR